MLKKEPKTQTENLKTQPENPKTETPEAPKIEETKDPNLEKITELTNDLQRTRADFENFRKNVEKDRENAKKLATESTILKFLPLLDDLDRAIAVNAELKPLAKNFEKSLKSLGLEKIETKPGTEFNPELHDAVMSEGDGNKETVAATLRPGYFYEGKVLRPAMVKVTLI